MKFIDKYLQKQRIKKASQYIYHNESVLDIGTADGILFEMLKGKISLGFGIDPLLPETIKKDFYTLIPGYFPDSCPVNTTYDVITMLAVLEHIPPTVQATLAIHCFALLNNNGRVIITVPSPKVDYILNVLKWLKLIDGMSLQEHYGFKPILTKKIFSSQYFLIKKNVRFQFGLNYLFVFTKK